MIKMVMEDTVYCRLILYQFPQLFHQKGCRMRLLFSVRGSDV